MTGTNALTVAQMKILLRAVRELEAGDMSHWSGVDRNTLDRATGDMEILVSMRERRNVRS